MKILHINEYYSIVGGLETYLHAILRELEARGYSSVVLHAEPDLKLSGRPGQTHYYVPGLIRPAAGNSDPIRQIDEILSREIPDIAMIHQALHPSVVTALERRLPMIRYAHDFTLVCPSGRKTWKRSQAFCARPAGFGCQTFAYRERCMPRNPVTGFRAIARTLRLAAIHRRIPILLASRFMREVFLCNGFPAGRLHVLPYFTTPPATTTLPRATPCVLFAGRLTPEKGASHLLQAIAKINHHPRVIVAGDGPQGKYLGELAESLGISDRVEFSGWLSPAQLRAHIERATLIVVPSIWPEPFGIIGIEAMAHARPVVAYDVGGISEWLEHGATGFMVPARDIGALADALDTVLEDPCRAATMGRAGRVVVERRFTAAQHMEHLLPLLDGA